MRSNEHSAEGLNSINSLNEHLLEWINVVHEDFLKIKDQVVITNNLLNNVNTDINDILERLIGFFEPNVINIHWSKLGITANDIKKFDISHYSSMSVELQLYTLISYYSIYYNCKLELRRKMLSDEVYPVIHDTEPLEDRSVNVVPSTEIEDRCYHLLLQQMSLGMQQWIYKKVIDNYSRRRFKQSYQGILKVIRERRYKEDMINYWIINDTVGIGVTAGLSEIQQIAKEIMDVHVRVITAKGDFGLIAQSWYGKDWKLKPKYPFMNISMAFDVGAVKPFIWEITLRVPFVDQRNDNTNHLIEQWILENDNRVLSWEKFRNNSIKNINFLNHSIYKCYKELELLDYMFWKTFTCKYENAIKDFLRDRLEQIVKEIMSIITWNNGVIVKNITDSESIFYLKQAIIAFLQQRADKVEMQSIFKSIEAELDIHNIFSNS